MFLRIFLKSTVGLFRAAGKFNGGAKPKLKEHVSCHMLLASVLGRSIWESSAAWNAFETNGEEGKRNVAGLLEAL